MGIFIPSYSRSYASNSYRRPASKKVPVKMFSFKAEDVWSAAAAATRINSGYLKEPRFEYCEEQNGSVQTAKANKVLVRELLEANQGWTEEDVARGAEARAYWQRGLLKLVGNTANDFEMQAIAISNKELIESAYDLAVASSLVASAERSMKRDEVNDRKVETSSTFQGKVGETLFVKNAEVMSVRYNQDFGKYMIEAIADGNLYAWWGHEQKVGAVLTVKGKVKRHSLDRATNAPVTQLNYVKVL